MVTLFGEVINTRNYTFTYGPAGNFIRRSHKHKIYTFTYGSAQRVILLGNFVRRSHKRKNTPLDMIPTG